jgi:alpha-glucosidase (family GH31 glycosyl hydrolase)
MSDEGANLRLTVERAPFRIVLGWGGTEARLIWPGYALAAGRLGPARARRLLSWDLWREPRGRLRSADRIVAERIEKGERTLFLAARDGRPLLRLSLAILAPGHLRWRLAAEAADADRIAWGWQLPSGGPERLWGFGERGRRVGTGATFETWAEEGGVGLGPLSPLLRWTGRVPFPKGPYASYAPMNIWLSSQGYLAWLEGTTMVRWRIGADRGGARAWSREMVGHLLVGRSPLALIEEATAAWGRPDLPPAWAFGPWSDSVGGQAAALDVARRLRAHRIPTSALWVEDWMGSREDGRRFVMRPLSHRLDDTMYPDLPALARELGASGMRLLGYFCPEVAHGTALYEAARAGGHLVCDAQGRPLVVDILGNRHGELDLTTERTRRWVGETLFEPARALGFDGWMADFGEYLPWQARLADGTDGREGHNRQPLLWQKTNRDFWRRARPDGDCTFFSRSATLGSQGVAQVVWGGDSDTDFDVADGLPTVVPQLLSAAVCGLPYWGTDIAGYMTFGLTRPADKELFWRWLELGALLPVMRTHHGTARPRNWHWDRDEETVRQYARYARLHAALFPYLYALAQAAARSGTPIARPLALAAPDDGEAWRLDDEFLLGPDLLVAPVVRRGVRRRRVYLPAGEWLEWFGPARLSGPAWVTVDAPLDRIPLFVRRGAVLPVFEGALTQGQGSVTPEGIVDSLCSVPGEGPDFTDLTRADRCLTLYVTAAGGGSAQIRDGVARLSRVDDLGEASAEILRADAPSHADHLPTGLGDGVAVRLASGRAATFPLGDERLRLTVPNGSPERSYVLRPWPGREPHGADANHPG